MKFSENSNGMRKRMSSARSAAKSTKKVTTPVLGADTKKRNEQKNLPPAVHCPNCVVKKVSAFKTIAGDDLRILVVFYIISAKTSYFFIKILHFFCSHVTIQSEKYRKGGLIMVIVNYHHRGIMRTDPRYLYLERIEISR